LKKLERHGQAWPEHDLSIGISAYPELYAIVGSKVPDYRGLFLRGHGSQSHAQENGSTIGVTNTTHSSGPLGTIQGDAVRNTTGETIVRGFETTGSGVYSMSTTASGSTDSGSINYWRLVLRFNAGAVTPVANEVRPINTAVRYFIRALP
jgi:hypothetical protein